MFISFKMLRLVAGLVGAYAASGSAQAQWLPPLGAAPPGEIVQRLSAQGYVLIGPLRRNQTVYLADANGPGGRERLVIDAWSGEILQRFVARPRSANPAVRGGYLVEGGEFSAPPPLGPPPARDFFPGPGYAYGAPSDVPGPSTVGPVGPPESQPRPKRPRPAATPHKPGETKPATASAPSEQAAKPPQSGVGAPGAPAPAGGAPTPSSAPTPAAESSVPAAPAPPPAQPVAPAPQAATEAPPAGKAEDKPKVNDVPVNPLE